MKRNQLVEVYLKDKEDPIHVLAMEVLPLHEAKMLDGKRSAAAIKAARGVDDLVRESEKAKRQKEAGEKRLKLNKTMAKARDKVEVVIDGVQRRVYKEEADRLEKDGKLGGKRKEKKNPLKEAGDLQKTIKEQNARIAELEKKTQEQDKTIVKMKEEKEKAQTKEEKGSGQTKREANERMTPSKKRPVDIGKGSIQRKKA